MDIFSIIAGGIVETGSLRKIFIQREGMVVDSLDFYPLITGKGVLHTLPVIDGETMAEVVANTGVSKDAGYLYYLGKDGNVWRTKMARGGKKTGGGPEMVATAGVSREDGFLYYIDKGGNVARSPMARGRR